MPAESFGTCLAMMKDGKTILYLGGKQAGNHFASLKVDSWTWTNLTPPPIHPENPACGTFMYKDIDGSEKEVMFSMYLSHTQLYLPSVSFNFKGI